MTTGFRPGYAGVKLSRLVEKALDMQGKCLKYQNEQAQPVVQPQQCLAKAAHAKCDQRYGECRIGWVGGADFQVLCPERKSCTINITTPE